MGAFMDFMKSFVDTWEKPVMDFGSLPVRSGGAADFPPVLSVVIPIYNVDQWLNDCLDSLRAQTSTAWECWLIDDGALDLSGIICDHYAKKDARFHVIHQKNQGVSVARNVGIEKATGKYLAFLDPDDFISENYFSAQLGMLEEHGADFSLSDVCYITRKGVQGPWLLSNIENTKIQRVPLVMKNNEEIHKTFIKSPAGGPWGKIFKKSFWGNVRFPEGIDLGEDLAAIIPTIMRANVAVYVPNSVYFYRNRNGSLSCGTVTEERLYRSYDASEEMYKKLVEFNPKRKDEYMHLKRLIDYYTCKAYLRSIGKKDDRLLMKIAYGEDSEEYKQFAKEWEQIEIMREIHRGSRRKNGS